MLIALHKVFQEVLIPILVAGLFQILLREDIIICMLLLVFDFSSLFGYSGLFLFLQDN
jgi:hypothetical protein